MRVRNDSERFCHDLTLIAAASCGSRISPRLRRVLGGNNAGPIFTFVSREASRWNHLPCERTPLTDKPALGQIYASENVSGGGAASSAAQHPVLMDSRRVSTLAESRSCAGGLKTWLTPTKVCATYLPAGSPARRRGSRDPVVRTRQPPPPKKNQTTTTPRRLLMTQLSW